MALGLVLLTWVIAGRTQPADAYITEVVTIPSDGIKLRARCSVARRARAGALPISSITAP